MNKLYYILIVLICTPTPVFQQEDVGAQTGIYTSFSAGEISPELHGRIDTQKFYQGCRILENFFVWAQGPVEKRRGTYYVGEVGGEIFPEVPEGEAVPPTYNFTYISENGSIYGVSVGDGEMTFGLDNDGVAVNVGGGIVGLPCAGHPFEIGEIVRISNTTNYNGLFTLGAGTTGNELQITDTYVAETFDGTEVIVKYIDVHSSAGRMCGDADGNLYYGHSGAHDTYITKIETDGTLVYDFFIADPVWSSPTGTVVGIKITEDNNFLYVLTDGPDDLYKFNLSDGSQLWKVSLVYVGYDIDLDADGNVYVPFIGGNLKKYDAADGTETEFTLMGYPKYPAWIVGHCSYAVCVNSDMGIVICGGKQYCLVANDETQLYNLAIRNLANTEGAQIALGGTYIDGALDYTYTIPTGCIITHNGYIYVLSYTPNCTLYKLDRDLNIITSAAGPTYGQGLYVDLWDNIVVVNQSPSDYQDDVLYFYDEDLIYLGKIENMYSLMLVSWGALVGGAWQQGNAVFDGILGTSGTPAIPAVIELADNVVGPPPARLFSFEYSQEDSYVIEAGTGYMRFYKDVQ